MAPVALTKSAREALRVLACCPGVPTDVFAQLIGAGHPVSAYQLLARLRARGLATSKQAVLGPLLGSRICNLWSLTQHGDAIVLAEGVASTDREVCDAGRERKRKAATVEVVASYRALAGLVAHEGVAGGAVRVLCWASPWMRSFQKPNTARISHVRLSGGATLEFRRAASARCVSVLLVTDIGTTPVSRYLPMVRRLAELRRVVPNWEPVLFVVTLDPGGTGARLQAWRSLVARAAHHGSLDARFATWHDLGKAAPSVRMPRPGSLDVCSATGTTGPDLGRSSENQSDQVLALLGRHPFLALRQLAGLLGTSEKRIAAVERGLSERGWLRQVELDEIRRHAVGLTTTELASVGLAELTAAGSRELARRLLLTVSAASRLHGVLSDAPNHCGKRRRLLRHLAHTLGCNEVFVAFATAARAVSERGGDEALEEWRSAAACERRGCRPDGYGRYRRGRASFGFFLEYDRGTERSDEYATKLRAYYKFRDSGAAAREYVGMPTLLFVSTSELAEERFAREAHLAWSGWGGWPLHVLLTTTERIVRHAEGIMGPIWRHAEAAGSAKTVERSYWLPRASAHGPGGAVWSHQPTLDFIWPTPERVTETGRGLSRAKPNRGHDGARS